MRAPCRAQKLTLVLQGYVEDYKTAFGAEPELDATQRQDLWSELASGAESGWDYSARWSRQIDFNKTDPYGNLRKLNVRAIVPVDLNSLLYADHAIVRFTLWLSVGYRLICAGSSPICTRCT